MKDSRASSCQREVGWKKMQDISSQHPSEEGGRDSDRYLYHPHSTAEIDIFKQPFMQNRLQAN